MANIGMEGYKINTRSTPEVRAARILKRARRNQRASILRGHGAMAAQPDLCPLIQFQAKRSLIGRLAKGVLPSA